MRIILLLFIALISVNTYCQDTPPLEVKVGFVVIDLSAINNVEETIDGEFVVLMEWTDTTLVIPGQTKAYSLEAEKAGIPDIQLRNIVNLQSLPMRHVTVDPDGRVRLRQRFTATINQNFDYREFPFDKQSVQFALFNAGSTRGVKLRADSTIKGFFNRDSISITDWGVKYAGQELVEMENFKIPIRLLNVYYEIDRNPGFYIWKVVVPLVLVVMMSWSVFWINPRNISAQLTVSVTAILTLIVFQFSVAQQLPALPYLTSLDKFTLGTDFFVFLAFIETILTSYLEDHGKVGISEKIDLVARWAFPLAFSLMLLTTLVF